MERKRPTSKVETSKVLSKSREKQKWQIAFRRYVIEQKPSPYYAPYFGLDVKNIRKWFEIQFRKGITWDNFGKKWQFDHIIPITYFDLGKEEELKTCWNFTNIMVSQQNNKRINQLDILIGKEYLKALFEKTHYSVCKKLMEKISEIEVQKRINDEGQVDFIFENRPYLDMIQDYSAFEFELLNSGRSIEEVKKEIAFMKKFENQP